MGLVVDGVSKQFAGSDGPVDALKSVSFTAVPGEMISVVGPNGAGKTTLLQIVAGVVVPTTGTVRRPRSTASLLEVGSSYEPDLTGRENLQLGLAFDGVPPRARTPALIEIAEFADLTKWLDHPIKHYSDGMIARLSAAQAVHRDVDLLLMDEAMSVGDASFERHLMRRVDEMRRRGTIVLVATHSLSLARQADRSIWLRSGSVVGDGPSLAVLRDYELSAGSGRVAAETPRAKFLSVSALPTVVEPGHRLTVSSELEILQPCDDLSLRIELRPVIGEEQWMRPVDPTEAPADVLVAITASAALGRLVAGTIAASGTIPDFRVVSTELEASVVIVDQQLRIHDEISCAVSVAGRPGRPAYLLRAFAEPGS